MRIVAYWDHPTSLDLAHAPKHAERIYKHHLGWAVDYGANTFLPGMAITRCNLKIGNILKEMEEGKIWFRQDIIEKLVKTISGCVATQDGHEYDRYYPIESRCYLRFGVQLIDAIDGAYWALDMVDPKGFIMEREVLASQN